MRIVRIEWHVTAIPSGNKTKRIDTAGINQKGTDGFGTLLRQGSIPVNIAGGISMPGNQKPRAIEIRIAQRQRQGNQFPFGGRVKPRGSCGKRDIDTGRSDGNLVSRHDLWDID